MKIIGGQWRGRRLTKKLNPRLRPTSNKVREAIFDILSARMESDWSDIRVLDLFAGTGAFGFEALSRGSSFVTFVDNHLMTTKEIQKNIREFELTETTEVLCRGALEVIPWLHRQDRRFDVIFLDPPYRQDWVMASLNRLQEFGLLTNKGVIVAEHDKRENLSAIEGFWHTVDARRYGDTSISFFCPQKMKAYWEARFTA
jgi:16S rRNA (guanine(966)-N(2))-methyltransferase RsmD